ncbi:MAG TPA: maleylpyruvate isomerase family mycothiol-dependent enzyme [Acidimicrobiales bacterium]|jgi:maleylpyruvate isomerase
MEDIRGAAGAQAQLDAAIAGLDDDTTARASQLPGWTVGHVLSHVARNADSHTRRSEAATRGERVEQYVGGYEGRAAEIDAGAARPANEIVDDVRSSAERLMHAWASLPDDAWSFVSPDVGGQERPLRVLPSRRWQELEVHAVDLGIGITHRDWSEEFVEASLPRLRPTLDARLPKAATAPAPGVLDERDELAWLYGRLQRDDLPTLAPWG